MDARQKRGKGRTGPRINPLRDGVQKSLPKKVSLKKKRRTRSKTTSQEESQT